MPRLIVIAGPTASGKSVVALELAAQLDGEVVNADAFQIYQGLGILTAQPGREEIERVSHHLYGILPLDEELTAARYASMAEQTITAIYARKKNAILCGGTGMYIKAITHGLDPMPPPDPVLRRELEAMPLEQLVHDLLVRDPEAVRTIDLKNPRRVIRALEIAMTTGASATELRQAWQKPPRRDALGFYLSPERENLHRRICARTEQMFARDMVVNEVRTAPRASSTASRAIGLREVQSHLAGELSLAECKQRINELTRQYAKRQQTWFRKERWMQEIPLDSRMSPGEIAMKIRESIQ